MKDKGYRLSAAVCALPAEDADKLISAGDGDCALLYIYLLRHGQQPNQELCRALGWEPQRLGGCAAKLRSLGLLSDGASARVPTQPADTMPEYTAEDVVRRSGEDPAFKGVLAEAESVLGHALSGADTRTLFGIYDFLGLPVDVIMELLHHCCEEYRLKFGPGRVPTMRQIEKEAYIWADREIMTFEQAEDYIRMRARLRDASESLRRSFGIHDRPLTPTERKYVEGWLEQGFTQGAIELAYDKTVTNTGQLKWNYMNRIIQSWHEKGLHTTQEIADGDAPRRSSGGPRQSQRTEPSRMGELERMKKIYDKVRGN